MTVWVVATAFVTVTLNVVAPMVSTVIAISYPAHIIARSLPPEPGTYAIVLYCTARRAIRIGRLGTMRLQPGFYVYVGSALGPGGLRARIAHHLRRAKRPRWHIDYLRAHARVDQLWYCCDAMLWEHQWASVLRCMPHAVDIAAFGSSDCACQSHLCFFDRRPSRMSFERCLQAFDPGKAARERHVSDAVAWSRDSGYS